MFLHLCPNKQKKHSSDRFPSQFACLVLLSKIYNKKVSFCNEMRNFLYWILCVIADEVEVRCRLSVLVGGIAMWFERKIACWWPVTYEGVTRRLHIKYLAIIPHLLGLRILYQGLFVLSFFILSYLNLCMYDDLVPFRWWERFCHL